MFPPDRKSRLRELAREILAILDLTSGHVEIHCHAGKPKQVKVMDTSLKWDDEREQEQQRMRR